jgi:hypothetical protein
MEKSDLDKYTLKWWFKKSYCPDTICLLDVLENDFGEVDEAEFNGVERAYERIFCILNKRLGWSRLNDV